MPVIATNWSGPTEFLSEEYSYPIPIETTETLKTYGDKMFFAKVHNSI